MAAGDTLQGHRLLPLSAETADSSIQRVLSGAPGDYFPTYVEGEEDAPIYALWCKLPSGSIARLSNRLHDAQADGWEITEDEMGRVTVAPSILQNETQGTDPPTPYWHGYLEHGIWREV